MNPSIEIEFMVGEKYENEKGIFTVLSIEKDDMMIRWASGEEAQTSMEFQDRIQQRRQWEKTRQDEKEAAAKPAPKKAKAPKKTKKAATEPH